MVPARPPQPSPLGRRLRWRRYHGLIYQTDISDRYGRVGSPNIMKQAGMVELPVLGLLKERPMHGYELRKQLGAMLGPFWQVSCGSLYPTLRRLAKAGADEVAEPETD